MNNLVRFCYLAHDQNHKDSVAIIHASSGRLIRSEFAFFLHDKEKKKKV